MYVTRPGRAALTGVILALLLCGGGELAAGEGSSFSVRSLREDRRALLERLSSEDVGVVARESRADPSDARALARRIDVLTRAGHLGHLEEAFRALGEQPPEVQRYLGHHYIWPLVRPLSWRRARRALELAPRAHDGYVTNVLRLWRREEPTADVLAWVRARWREAPEAWLGTWTHELWYAWATGDREPLLAWKADLEKRLVLEPGDEDAARTYTLLGSGSGCDEAWFAAESPWRYDLLRPASVAACCLLARWAPDPAQVLLLERAHTLPFTDADGERLRRSWGSRGPNWGAEADVVRRAVSRSLAALHQRAGNVLRAQQLIDELTADGKESDIGPSLAELSGTVQGRSGFRVVEGRLRSAEEEEGDTARYWRARARYFVGRREKAQADEAFARALELARDPDPKSGAKGTRPERWQVLDDWIRWLLDSGRTTEGFAVARREFEAASPDSGAALLMTGWLLDAKAPRIAPDDAFVWRYVLATEDWRERDANGYLWKLLTEQSPGTDPRLRPATFDRARGAVRGRHPGRALVLGSVAIACGELDRALPLLEDAVERCEDCPGHLDRKEAKRRLFEAHGRAGRWRSMEALIQPDWQWGEAWPFVETARVALRERANADALRLWARAVNLDRGDIARLDVLAEAGLREELIAFYERLGVQDPDCDYVPAILAKLRGSEKAK